MKYEIEIDGKIPDGWEVDRIGQGRTGDRYLGPILSDGFFQINQVDHHSGSGARVIVRRKVRKYDWSKTLDDILTLRIGHEEIGLKPLHKQDAHYKIKLPEVWQPNVHGECPVDPEASIVRVRFMNGDELECKAKNLSWTNLYHPATIASWQFIRLSDGYEW